MPTQLPPKENTLFKRILKCYEQKQYKNGLKFCKQILTNTKFAEHGETLAMKGLTLNCLGRKEEAYDFVRKGLRNDLKSHVCWHVYGLLQRSDRKYDEAIKCYRNALKWDKDNIQILRDLSLLQIQMRDLDGFRETRYQLLKLRPAQRQSWIGYSISHYLLEDHELALQIMEEYRKTQYLENQLTKSSLDFEHSEMLLYQNMIHRENGRAKEALDHLDKYEKHITDKLQVKELKANLYLQIGNNQAAERIYRDLLKRNPENWSYYEKLEACLKPETEQDRAEIYLHYRRIFPRVEAPKRLSLNFVTGETFKRFADEYLRNALRKGVPPLFVNLRGLYRDYGKATIFAKIIQGYIHNLETQSKFSESDQCKEDPTVLLWTYFFAAQHYDQQRKIDVALEYINKVLEHTPTLIEGYMVKARIYKHAGCSGEAVRWMDEGRSLDTADRYVNSKCAKYLLRNNQIKKSEEICGLFTREGIPANENLDEMQCMWFLTECARAHQRLGDIGEALKKCHQIDRIFSEIIEDQFDFHTYCMRKVTLTAYIRLLRLEDILRSHPFYFRAAKVALECYIRLYDKPYQEGDKDDDLNKGNLTAQELKKIKSKQRRAKKKAQREEEKKANENKENKETEKKEEKKERFDANVLVKTETPLEDAMKFLVPLQLLAKERLETHLFAFEIYFRKGKPLLMLQSIKRAIKIEPNNHKLHECIIRFVKTVNDSREKYNKVVISVLDKEMPAFVTHEDLATYNTEYLMKHKHSFACRISVAKMDYHLDHSKKDDAVHVLTDLSDNCSLEDCTTVYNLLNDGYVDDSESTLEEYKIACHNRFPLADVFQPEKSRDEKENAKNDAHLNMNGESHLVDGEIDGPLDDTMYP